MDSNNVWIVLIFILIGAGFTTLEVLSHKAEIRETLEKKGSKNIRVSWQPLDFDKSNHTYSVEYEDANGKLHQTSCKIHVLGSTIYWEDKP